MRGRRYGDRLSPFAIERVATLRIQQCDGFVRQPMPTQVTNSSSPNIRHVGLVGKTTGHLRPDPATSTTFSACLYSALRRRMEPALKPIWNKAISPPDLLVESIRRQMFRKTLSWSDILRGVCLHWVCL